MRHENNLISVIMPCFNVETYVETAVKSALGQLYTQVELIVVDDGSTDNSIKILDSLVPKYGERLVILRQRNKGPYPARNYGLSKAKGDYIAFLDADDYWEPNCLSKLYQNLRKFDADIAYCGWQNVGDDSPGTAPHVPPDYRKLDVTARFLQGCPWPIHAALTRRQVIEAVGGFSESWYSAMDFDLWLRISAITHNMVLVPERLAYYRWHGDTQISASKCKQARNAWCVRKRFVQEHPEAVKHIKKNKLRELVHGDLLNRGYDAFWKGDISSAQQLFRMAFRSGFWTLKDIKYVVSSLLPAGLFCKLVALTRHQ